jgi:hypothetical protein
MAILDATVHQLRESNLSTVARSQNGLSANFEEEKKFGQMRKNAVFFA